MKQKAARNKTIDFSLEEGHEYWQKTAISLKLHCRTAAL